MYAAVGEVHSAFRVVGKPGEKFFTDREHLKRLIAGFGDTPRHANIVIVADHASEGVTRKIAGSGLLPGRDHASVQPASQRHANSLIAAEVARKVPGESLAQSLIVGLRPQFLLGVQLPRV